ncbi:MAG: plasmid pRiA4b ORF-3 family protein [Verrucomicrobia bacterium]|nr:plasmid pRiA4b ORF-3 family protein [Verrucomicrobiota bacterium]MCH8510702.1 plasmid pRiA4b ORF-3 family protein [Kiritimatiellia bacterium]
MKINEEKVNEEKIDDAVLAILQLTAHHDGVSTRAWKGQSWEVLDRLYQKGWISNPKGKAKSVVFTDEGLKRSELLFKYLFQEGAASPSSAMPSERKKENKTGGTRIRISLRYSDPEIWRELCIPDGLTLGDLHRVIQIVMDWDNDHMHQFIHKKKLYGEPMDDFGFELLDEEDFTVSDFFPRKGSRIMYEYDFGDSWIHDVVSLGKASKGDPFFHVFDGAMASPPEDCGGVWGYSRMLEALADSNDPEHEDYLEWMNADFDPKAFNRDKINKRLSKILKSA